MEPHSLVGGMGGKVVSQVGAWPAASKTNASWPAHQLGREKWLIGGRKKWKIERLLSSFSQRVPPHVPSPPSRWAGRYGPFAVRAAGQVSRKRYSLPPHNPTREGSPEGRTSSLWGSFPHFFPRNGAPAGQAKFLAVPTAPGKTHHRLPRQTRRKNQTPCAGIQTYTGGFIIATV